MTDEERSNWIKYQGKDWRSNVRKDAIESLYDALGQVKDGGNVVITGCSAGKGSDGLEFGTQLVNGRKINLYLNQDISAASTALNSTGTRNTGYALISLPGGKLTDPSNLRLGWRKFAYDTKNGRLNISNSKNQVIIGPTGGTVPIKFNPF